MVYAMEERTYTMRSIDRDSATDVSIDLLHVAGTCGLDEVIHEPLKRQRALNLSLQTVRGALTAGISITALVLLLGWLQLRRKPQFKFNMPPRAPPRQQADIYRLQHGRMALLGPRSGQRPQAVGQRVFPHSARISLPSWRLLRHGMFKRHLKSGSLHLSKRNPCQSPIKTNKGCLGHSHVEISQTT